MEKIFLRVFCCHFFCFYFLNALQSDINSNRVYVVGHQYVLGPSQTHFKMSLSRAQNIFMPANINSIVILGYCVEIWRRAGPTWTMRDQDGKARLDGMR